MRLGNVLAPAPWTVPSVASVLTGGGHEVIPVEQVYRCDVYLNGSYGGRNAIYKLAKIDAPSLKVLRAISG